MPRLSRGKAAEVLEHVKDYLERHPDAAGTKGADDYNSDKSFGGRYGEINGGLLNRARFLYKDELSLPDLRGKHDNKHRGDKWGHGEMPPAPKAKRGSKTDALEHIKDYLKEHPDAAGSAGAVAYNSDGDFGKAYGEVDAKQINRARHIYKEELGLTDLRSARKEPEAAPAPKARRGNDQEAIRGFLKKNPEATGQGAVDAYNEEFGEKAGEMTLNAFRQARKRYRGELGLPKMTGRAPGSKVRKKTDTVEKFHLKEFFTAYPESHGEKGADAYNSDERFGGKYGEISYWSLDKARARLRSELGLPKAGRKLPELTQAVISFIKQNPEEHVYDIVRTFNEDPELGVKYGEITRSQVNAIRHRHLSGLPRLKGGRHNDKHLDEFLKEYKDAYGDQGVKKYNSDPNFGGMYGTIILNQLKYARSKYKDELGLTDARRGSRTGTKDWKKGSIGGAAEREVGGRIVSETTLLIKDYLKINPHAAGQSGTDAYNSDGDFGKAHGEISKSQLARARNMFKAALGLPDARGSAQLLQTGDKGGRPMAEETVSIKEYLELHPYAVGEKGADDYNKDPEFGEKRGTITKLQLANARLRYRKELKLPDARGRAKQPKAAAKPVGQGKRGRDKSSATVDEVIRAHPDVHDVDEMAKVVEAETGFHYAHNSMKYRMRRCGAEIAYKQRTWGGKPVTPKDGGISWFPRMKSDLITKDILSAAIKKSVSGGSMEDEAADELAGRVLNFFGYGDVIIDNMLTPEDRDMFYMLEDAELLDTSREETTLYDGREWRIHYWFYMKDNILGLAKKVEKHEELPIPELTKEQDEEWAEMMRNRPIGPKPE